MPQPIGKVLNQTREQRGLTIAEAAHATKLRPDKIVALEAGDYASFPSNAYARGFLQIYGRFLEVDVREEVATLDTTNRLSVEDYQYLTAARAPAPETRSNLPDLSKRKKPSFVPLVAFFTVIVVASLGFSAFVNWQRINGKTPKERAAAEPELAVEEAPTPVAAAAPAAPLAVEPSAPDPIAMPPRPALSDREFLGEPAPAAPVAAPAEAPMLVPNPDRDQVNALAVPMNEVEISVTKKTWVKIRKDDDTTAPIFEDYLYPGVGPLKLKGTRFLIEARDPDAVEIRKNGDPIAYQAPGVTVQ